MPREGRNKKKCKHPPIPIFTNHGLISAKKIPYQILFMSKLKERYVDRLPIFCAIPCTIKDTYEEGDVLSVRWNGVVKGVKGKCFPNAMIIDLWFHGAKYHTKLFQNGKLQICNLKSYQEAWDLIKTVCTILRKATEYISYLKVHTRINALALRWLRDNSKGEAFEYLITSEQRKDPVYGNVRFCSRVTEYRIQWPEEIPDEYLDIVNDFKLRNSDLSRDKVAYLALVARVKKIIKFSLEGVIDPDSEDNSFSIKNLKYVSCVTRYDLGFDINRYELNKLMIELGYDCYFSNQTSSKVRVKVPNTQPFDKKLVHRSDTSGTELFVFNPRGTVTHNGYMESMMKKTFKSFLHVIWTYRERIAAKQGPTVVVFKPTRKLLLN
jgi:hypothetical protein